MGNRLSECDKSDHVQLLIDTVVATLHLVQSIPIALYVLHTPCLIGMYTLYNPS